MNIIGPDALAFGVDDVGACKDLPDRLRPPTRSTVDDTGGFFEALLTARVFSSVAAMTRACPLRSRPQICCGRLFTASRIKRPSRRSPTSCQGTGRSGDERRRGGSEG